jgi:hypothetical protein
VFFSRRHKQRIVSLAVLTLASWLIAFAAHLHTPDRDPDATRSSAHHACVLCAAVQPGAGAVPELQFRAPPGAVEVAVSVVLPALRQHAHHSYRSRAPPAA